PVAIVDGKTGEIEAHILHYPFSHGVAHWIARHNKYSDMEALEALKLHDGRHTSIVKLVSSDPNERLRAMKDVFFKLPARPLVKFFYYYIWRRGFMDGRPGFTYATLQAIYEYFIACKHRELLRRQGNLPI
ncbi:MAG: glycosyltransferase family 2 protein, partial [Steroidobacter sp.]